MTTTSLISRRATLTPSMIDSKYHTVSAPMSLTHLYGTLPLTSGPVGSIESTLPGSNENTLAGSNESTPTEECSESSPLEGESNESHLTPRSAADPAAPHGSSPRACPQYTSSSHLLSHPPWATLIVVKALVRRRRQCWSTCTVWGGTPLAGTGGITVRKTGASLRGEPRQKGHGTAFFPKKKGGTLRGQPQSA